MPEIPTATGPAGAGRGASDTSAPMLGAMGMLTAEHVLGALRSVKQGRIYDLSHILERGMPMSKFHGDYEIETYRSLAAGYALQEGRFGPVVNGYAPQNRRIAMSDQTGTHIDDLTHVAVRLSEGDFLMFGGVHDAGDLSAVDRPGIELMPPLVGRAVVLDLTSRTGPPGLPAGHAISVRELRAAADHQGVRIEPGDTVMIHTGWARHWDPGGEHEMLLGEPGLTLASARWLADQGVVCIGADNFAVEVVPPEVPGVPFPAHIELLVGAGVRMLENLYLDELVGDGISECCLIVAPLKIRGGTGSPVRPLALV